MAGDWIKVESVTPTKPEVYKIADVCDIEPEHAFGSLICVWIWADQHTENGNACCVTKKLVDRTAGVSGFADAMISVGWLLLADDGVEFPNFDRHNGKTAKNRALTAKRVANHKIKDKSNAKGNADANGVDNAKVTLGALPREEKRREEFTTTDVVVTPPPKIPHHQSLIDNWQPSPATIEALTQLHRIPGQFIAEQLVEFKTYWRDRADPKTSWDAAFLKRCPQQWKSYGAEWRRVADDEFLDKHTDKTWAENLQ